VKPLLLVAAAAIASLAGCDRCSGPKKAPQADRTPVREAPPSTPARSAPVRDHGPATMPGKVRLNAPLDPEEALGFLPPLAGAPLGAPTVAGNGAQVRFPYCLGGTTLDVAGRRAEQSLRDAGWNHVTANPPDAGAPVPRFGIAADRDDLRLSVTIESSARPDCSADTGKFFATAVMNRVAAPGPAP
jgi:hypothetical protein